jgi:hypothetical protein
MIADTTNQIPELHGIIFIDCWEESQSKEKKKALDEFYQLIVDRTVRYKFKCAVNSAVNIALDMNDHSVFNTFNKYAWGSHYETSPYIKARRDQLLATLCQYTSRSATDPLTTSKIIQNNFLNSGRGMLLLDTLDLIFHNDLFLNSECKNWLIVGQSWQNCVHNNHMGLKQFAKLSNEFDINFYATDYSFLKDSGGCANDNDFVDDTLSWTRIIKFGYQLMPDKSAVSQFPLLRYRYFHI